MHLLSVGSSSSTRAVHTASLLPGSFTMVYCSSLYFLNAGSSDRSKLGSSFVKALISAIRLSCALSCQAISIHWRTSHNIGELARSARSVRIMVGCSYQPLPAALLPRRMLLLRSLRTLCGVSSLSIDWYALLVTIYTVSTLLSSCYA